MSSRETFIENNVIRHREAVLGVRDALFVRRCRIWPGHGIADLVFLPQRGAHRLVIVEAKQASSPDAKSKVIGQLLMYYAGALNFGSRGLRHVRRYAVDHARASRSRRPTSGKVLSGGLTPPQAAWTELGKGRRIRPDQIALYAALDVEPSPGLKRTLTLLSREHDLDVGVVSVLARDELQLWRP